MRNIFPFMNGLRNHHAYFRNAGREYIRKAFARRHLDPSSAAYARDAIRDAIRAVRCCNALLGDA